MDNVDIAPPVGMLSLAASVVRWALKEEGPSWVDTIGGRWWTQLLGLNPSSLKEQAAKEGWPDSLWDSREGKLRDNKAKVGYKCRCGNRWLARGQGGPRRCSKCKKRGIEGITLE